MPQYLQGDNLSCDNKLPSNTLLLRKSDLEFLYGPLSRRIYLGFREIEEEVVGEVESVKEDEENSEENSDEKSDEDMPTLIV